MIKKFSLHIFNQKKRFNLFLCSTVLFLLSFPVSYSQESNNDSIKESEKEYFSKEKIYLHFDKPYYASGDDIWFKVYLVNADTHQQNAMSKIVYVDLIDYKNEIIESKVIKIINGSGLGDFKLALNLASGVYTIRAYTNFMRNYDSGYFFRKKINVSSLNKVDNSEKKISKINRVKKISSNALNSTRPDIQFFPEGGYLVNSLINRMGFKALDINGKGIDIKGSIIDEDGRIITMFKSSKFGLGKIAFKPQRDVKYKAIIDYNGQKLNYDLPQVLAEGIVMQIEEQQDLYLIKLQSSNNKDLNNLILHGQQHGEVICNASINVSQNKASIRVLKTLLKQGILQFTLLDNNISPICERLVFYEKDKNYPKVNISFSKRDYIKRELVEMEISLDTMQIESEADISVSITDASVVHGNNYDLDIKSHLLLNSELRGEIENPGYYFMSDDSNRKKELDNLMMTQGWRRYIYNDVLKGSTYQFKMETGISFKGSLINENQKISNKEITLLFKNKETLFLQKMKTNNQGNFMFGEFDIVDSTSIIIQATRLKENNRLKNEKIKKVPYNGTINLEKFNAPELSQLSNSIVEINTEYIERNEKILKEESKFKLSDETINLDEVVLKPVKVISQEEIRKENKRKHNALYLEPSYVVDFYDLVPTGDFLSMLKSMVPGGLTRGRTSLTKAPQPLFLIDGNPTELDTTGFQDVLDIDIYNIDFVDILKGPSAAIYGSRGSNGVVAIYTKGGTEGQEEPNIGDRKGIVSFIHPGYSRAREFYEPKYVTYKPEHQKTDYRSTLCWKPDIKMNSNGKANIEFYAADISTTYRVELEGITSDGIPITSEAFINID